MFYLAIDIGASSGRHIVGWKEKGVIKTREVYRFANGCHLHRNHLIWDIENLFREIKKGIAIAFQTYPKIQSLSIDTWGVDYVLMDEDHEILPCYSYRDNRTYEQIPHVHTKISFSELYRRTGCQFQPFNSIYQLMVDYQDGRLKYATDFLMIPEYLIYKLTGIKVKEFTNATTTGMVDTEKKDFNEEIIQKLSLPTHLFPRLMPPKTIVGQLQPHIVKEVGGQCNVVLCATHDTASAVEGIPLTANDIYISSGTWSLLGVRTAKAITNQKSQNSNYSNEGGVGYNRYQKNIMGMWLIQTLQKELCPEMNFSTIVEEAENSTFEELVDVNAPEFLSPSSMKDAFDNALQSKPNTNADYFRCAYRSLARSYKMAIEELENNTTCRYERIFIVGGGAKNKFLNRLTEEMTGKCVIALPIEATALGNLKLQMEVSNDKI